MTMKSKFDIYYSEKQEKVAVEVIEQLSNSNDSRLHFWNETDTYNRFQQPNVLTSNDVKIVDNISLLQDIAYALVSNIKKEKLKGKKIAIDFETTGINSLIDKVKGIGVYDGTTPYYIVVDKIDNDKLIGDYLQIIEENFTMLFWNAKFELSFLKTNWNIEPKNYLDVALCEYILKGTKFPKLSDAANLHLKRYPKSWKDLKAYLPEHLTPIDELICESDLDGQQKYIVDELPLDVVAPYCAEDVYETFHLWEIYQTMLDKKLLKVLDIDNAFCKVAAEMELTGVKVSVEAFQEAEQKLLLDLERIKDTVYCEIGYDINFKSPDQLNKLFFEELNLNPKGLKKTKKGYSTDAESLRKLELQHWLVSEIIDYKSGVSYIDKFTSKIPTYLPDCLGDNCIHPSINNTATATGRLSYSKPNLQQIPNPKKVEESYSETKIKLIQSIRKAFIPRDGMRMIVADWSGFELAILAYLSKEKLLLDCINKGKSLHDVLTCMLFNLSTLDKSNPQHIVWRTFVKTIVFGIIYGMEAHKLFVKCQQLNLDYSITKCNSMLNEVFNMIPKVKQFLTVTKLTALRDGYTETILGRRRYFSFINPYLQVIREHKRLNCDCETALIEWNKIEKMGWLENQADQKTFREIQNAPIQGSNGDYLKIAVTDFYNKAVDLPGNCNILLLVHDEIVIECSSEFVDHYYSALSDSMKLAPKFNFPVNIGIEVCDNWGEGK